MHRALVEFDGALVSFRLLTASGEKDCGQNNDEFHRLSLKCLAPMKARGCERTMTGRPKAASPVNNPASNQPDLEKAPRDARRRRVGHRWQGSQERRGTRDKIRLENIAEIRRRFRQRRQTGNPIDFPLGENLPRAMAVVLLTDRLLAATFSVRQQTGNQSALTAARTDPEHEHGQHRGEAGRM